MNSLTKKTKVLFVVTKSNFGGAQKYVHDLATNIPKDRFEAVVALGGSGTLIQKLHEQHIRTLPILSLTRDVNVLSDLAAFFELWSIFRKEKPDVVHLNSAKAGGIGALAARLARVPKIIFTAHGWAFNEDRPLLQRAAIKFFSWITILLSHEIIAVSEATAHDAPSFGMRGKIVVIYPFVSPSQNILEKEIARKHFIKNTPSLHSDGRLWIGIVAELHKNKGICYAIEAMNDAYLQNNSVLIVIGEGQERQTLENLIRKNNLEKSVFLLGFQENASNFMSAFDIFLFPSTTEAFGYVATEAGLAGLPVLASRVGGIPEIIEDNKTGILVPPHNPSAIRAGLVRLIDSPSLRSSFGVSLKEKVLQNFAPNNTLLATLPLYETA